VDAQPIHELKDAKPAHHLAEVWTNAFYGPNNSGAGIGIRWWYLGCGVSAFQFAGDSAAGLPPRPAGTFMTFDFHLVIDFTDWLGLSAYVGAAPRIATAGGLEVSQDEKDLTPVNVGANLLVSLAGRFVIGAGYGSVLSVSEGELPAYDPLPRVVAQLGYRF
jgi:hypothetical protein